MEPEWGDDLTHGALTNMDIIDTIIYIAVTL